MRAVFILLILAYVSSINLAQSPQPTNGNLLVCYYTYWSSMRRPPFDFQPEDIDPFLCTHLIYAYVFIGKNFDLDKSRGNFTDLQPRLIKLKQRNPQLKVMIATVGGFGVITENQKSRMAFSRKVVAFLRENDFDGIELNWQHPTFREGGKAEDMENYVILALTLREQFEREAAATGRPRLILSISLSCPFMFTGKTDPSENSLPGYNIYGFNTYVDFISLLCYDYRENYNGKLKHHAPLYSVPKSFDYEEEKTLNIDYAIDSFLGQADARKLVLGVPAYGRSRALVDPSSTDQGAEADGPGDPGPYTGEPGFLAYFEVCSKIINESWNVVQTKPYGLVGPHAFKGNQWVGYDDPEMVMTKALYAKRRGLAGVGIWTLDFDDFRGTCGRRYPLTNAAKLVFNTKTFREGTEMLLTTDQVRTTVQLTEESRTTIQPTELSRTTVPPTDQPITTVQLITKRPKATPRPTRPPTLRPTSPKKKPSKGRKEPPKTPPKKEIYIKERLASKNKKNILGRARRLLRERKVSFAGIFNGKILVKKRPQDDATQILDFADLDQFDT